MTISCSKFHYFFIDKIANPILGHCNEIQCQFGAKCEQQGQTAQCKCNPSEVCRNAKHNPTDLSGKDQKFSKISTICGSNKMKYSNECELKMHMCLIQEQIDIRNEEKCL